MPEQTPEDHSKTEGTVQAGGEAGKESAPHAKRQRYGKNLDHFYRVNKQAEYATEQPSFFDNLLQQIAALKQSGGAFSAKFSPDHIKLLARQNKTIIAIAVSAVILIFLAIVIIPLIPLQLQRSNGYAAFQQGNYTEAYRELESYLQERPTDHTAAYVAAQAALFSGDKKYARQAISALYTTKALSQESGIDYYYALFHLQQPQQAISVLDSLLERESNHAAARLLRGFLLSNQPGKVRQARDDFLQLDEVLRNGEEFSQVQFLHRYIQEEGLHQLSIDLPPYEGTVRSALRPYIGAVKGLDGLMFSLNPSGAEAIRQERLAPSDITNLYFMYMLLRQGELEEAESILMGLLRNSPDKLAIKQADAFFSVYKKDYPEARRRFEEIAQALPADAKTLNSFAIMGILVSEGEIDIEEIADIYDRVANGMGADTVELNNSSYFALLEGDFTVARQRLEQAVQNLEVLPVQVKLNKGLIDLINGEVESAKASFEAIDAAAIAQISHYIVAAYEKSGDFNNAIDALEKMQSGQENNHDMFMQRIDLIVRIGEWRVAFFELLPFVEKNPRHYKSVYILGRLALRLGEAEVFNEQKSRLARVRYVEEARHYADALDGAFLADQGATNAAIAAYYQAITNAEGQREQAEYLVEWAMLNINTSPARAVSVLSQYVDKHEDSRILALLAYGLVESDAAEAAAYVDWAISGVRDHIVNLYAGGALIKIGNYKAAVPLIESAASQRPVNIPTLELLQQGYQGIGDEDNARRIQGVLDYLNALSRGEGPVTDTSYRVYLPRNKEIINPVRVALSGNGEQLQEVYAAYAQALEAVAESPQKRAELLYSQATFETYFNHYEQAIALFEEALALGLGVREEQIEAMLFYAEVLSLTERHRQAAQVLERTMSLYGETLLYRRLYALAVAGQENRQEAATLLQSLLSDYPADRNTHYALADLYREMQEYKAAIEILKQLLHIYPNDFPGYKSLSELYTIVGDAKKAQIYSAIYSETEKKP